MIKNFKSKFKTALVAIMAVTMVIGLCPVSVFAANGNNTTTEENAVCKIESGGNTYYYATLQTALNDAAAGDIIETLPGAELSFTEGRDVQINKAVTIINDGATLTNKGVWGRLWFSNGATFIQRSGVADIGLCSSSGCYFFLEGGSFNKDISIGTSSCTISGGTISAKVSTNGITTISGGTFNSVVEVKGTTTQTNGTISGKVQVSDDGTYNLQNGTLTGGVCVNDGSFATLSGGSINANTGVELKPGATATISDDISIHGSWYGVHFSNNSDSSKCTTVNINGGTITGGTGAIGFQECSSTNIHVNINGGYIKGGNFGSNNDFHFHNSGVNNINLNNVVTITSGCFGSQSCRYELNGTLGSISNLAGGVTPVKEGDWYVIGTPAVSYKAETGDIQYETLSDAITNAQANATVTLLSNNTENCVIDKNLIIDLNAKSLNGTLTVNTDCNVTIQNGTVSAIVNNGTVTLPSGLTVSGTVTNSGNMTISGGTYGQITNNGTLSISGGTFSKSGNTTNNDEFIHSGSVISSKIATLDGTSWIIEDAPVPTNEAVIGDTEYLTLTAALSDQNNNTVRLLKNILGDYTITNTGTLDLGGFELTGTLTVDSDVTAAIQNGTVSAVVNNGSATLSSGLTVSGTVTNSANMTISGGTYNTISNNGTLSISGGSFTKANNTTDNEFTYKSSIVADKKAVESGDYWVVQDKVYVAQIGSNKYESLNDALSAQNTNETITLLSNVSGDFTAVQSGTLDLNGFTLAGTVTVSSNVASVIQNGTLNLTSLTNAGTLTLPAATTVTGTLTNSGTINEIAGGSFASVSNSGTIGEISAGTFGPVSISGMGDIVEISGGTFGAISVSESGKITLISNGTFAQDGNTTEGEFNFSSAVDSGKKAIKNSGNWVIVTYAGNVAEMDGVLYPSLQAAVSAVPVNSTKTITMIADTHENGTVLIDDSKGTANITIDLNGYVVYGDYENRVIEQSYYNGSLTINDSRPLAAHEDTSLPSGGVITGGYASDGGNGGWDYGHGGGILSKGILVMNGGTIYNCKADHRGGGICSNNSGKSFTMNGGCILNCEAGNYSTYGGRGGGIESCSDFIMNGGTVENCIAYGSTVNTGKGGGVEVTGAKFTMTGSAKITNCYALARKSTTQQIDACGGGVYLTQASAEISGNAEISNCYAKHEDASIYCYGCGGGIFAQDCYDSKVIEIKNGKIINCYADREGGGIAMSESSLEMTGGIIDECTCVTKGGGGFSYWGKNHTADWHVYLTHGSIKNCTALYHMGSSEKADEIPGGGAICAYDNAMTIGGDYLITGNMITNGNNTKKAWGGGVLLGNENAHLNVWGTPRIIGNTADDTVNNVFLYTGTYINVIGSLEDDCSIGVTTLTKPTQGHPVTVSTGYESHNGNDLADLYFLSDDPAYIVLTLDPVDADNHQYGEVILTLPQDEWMQIVYHDNGGTFSSGFNTVDRKTHDANATDFTFNIASSNVVTPPAGYTFQGWNTVPVGSGVTYNAGDENVVFTGHGTVHLYAQWHRIISYNLTVGSDLKMNLYVQGIPESSASGYTMKFYKNDNVTYISQSSGTKVEGYGYKFTLTDQYPQNMGNVIVANLYDNQGIRVASIKFSTFQYLQSLYNAHCDGNSDVDVASVKLASDILAYGAVAYKYQFGTVWSLPDWVSANKSQTIASVPANAQIITDCSSDDIEITGCSLLLADSIFIRYTITVKNDNDSGFIVKDGKKNVLPVYTDPTASGATVSNLNAHGTYYVKSAAIKATGGASGKVISLYQGNTLIQQAKDSIYSYIARNYQKDTVCGKNGQTLLSEMCTAIYNYCNSSLVYVNTLSNSNH